MAAAITSKLSRSDVVTILVLSVPVLCLVIFICWHLGFQHRVVGVMKFSTAQKIGLLSNNTGRGAFPPKIVWLARTKDGRFEYRTAWPIIGSMTFPAIGNGTTGRDLLDICDRLGEVYCLRV